MVVSCAAYNCSERSKKGGLSFHSFPFDDILRQKWIEAVRRKDYNPSLEARLCSKHFTSDCFENSRSQGLRRLKKGSVPSIFDFSTTRPKKIQSKKPARPEEKPLNGKNESSSRLLVVSENSTVTESNSYASRYKKPPQLVPANGNVATTPAVSHGQKRKACVLVLTSEDSARAPNSTGSTAHASDQHGKPQQVALAEEIVAAVCDGKRRKICNGDPIPHTKVAGNIGNISHTSIQYEMPDGCVNLAGTQCNMLLELGPAESVGKERHCYIETVSSEDPTSHLEATNTNGCEKYLCSPCDESAGESNDATSAAVNCHEKREYFIGDFSLEDLESPENAVKCLKLALDKTARQRKQIKYLQQRERRLMLKVDELEAAVTNLQENCRVTDDALTLLLLENEQSSEELLVQKEIRVLQEITSTSLGPSPPSPNNITPTSENLADIIARRSTRMEEMEGIQTQGFETEPISIQWDSLRRDEQQAIHLPSSSEVFNIAHTLRVNSTFAKGRDINEVDATLTLVSYWPRLTPEVRKYAFNRLQLLFIAMKNGWDSALRLFEMQSNIPAFTGFSNSSDLEDKR